MYIHRFLSFLILLSSFLEGIDDPRLLPISYQGRYIPLEVYAKLQQKDLNLLLSSDLPHLKMIPTLSNPLNWTEMQALLDSHQRILFKNRELLKKTYLEWLLHPTLEGGKPFAEVYFKEYTPFSKVDYPLSKSSRLTLPSLTQLKLERYYRLIPFTPFVIFGYFLSIILYLFNFKRSALSGWIVSYGLSTTLLILRAIILGRPPVASMGETLFYVPWVVMTLALLFYFYFKSYLLPLAASCIGMILLSLLEITFSSQTLENIQPVLNSSFWLTIHVLMIVASYGAFILAGVLAHGFLVYRLTGNKYSSPVLIQLLYVGVTLLIPGTLLGGVWAAQSWGRFWDWDPKESWAFISAACYLILIHLYRFKKISSFGVEVGSILGMLIITFTWYGVNYILGTGLHSYGFGSGGEPFYLGFIGFEFIFLISILTIQKNSFRKKIFLQNTLPKD